MTHPEFTKCWFSSCDRPTDGHKICEFHRLQAKAKRREYREEGRCSSSGCPRWPEEGYKQCRYHIEYGNLRAARDPERHRKKNVMTVRRARIDVLNAYGGACCVCGETDPIVLELDHINGLDSVDPTWPRGGAQLHATLRRAGFPQGLFQILCANCHRRKTYATISRDYSDMIG